MGNTLQFCCYDVFLDKFMKTFSHPVSESSAARRLLSLCQGRRIVADFLIDFRTANTEAGWVDPALQGVFFQSLNDRMKDQLASREEPASLEELASLSFQIDNRLRESEGERGPKPQRSFCCSSLGPAVFSPGVAQEIGLPLVSIEPPIPIQALNNQPVAQIQQHSVPVRLVTSGNHREEIVFYALHSPDTPLTFGLTWLR